MCCSAYTITLQWMQSPYKNYKTTAGIQLLASSSTTTDSSGIAETRLLSAIKATDHAAVVSSGGFTVAAITRIAACLTVLLAVGNLTSSISSWSLASLAVRSWVLHKFLIKGFKVLVEGSAPFCGFHGNDHKGGQQHSSDDNLHLLLLCLGKKDTFLKFTVFTLISCQIDYVSW